MRVTVRKNRATAVCVSPDLVLTVPAACGPTIRVCVAATIMAMRTIMVAVIMARIAVSMTMKRRLVSVMALPAKVEAVFVHDRGIIGHKVEVRKVLFAHRLAAWVTCPQIAESGRGVSLVFAHAIRKVVAIAKVVPAHTGLTVQAGWATMIRMPNTALKSVWSIRRRTLIPTRLSV